MAAPAEVQCSTSISMSLRTRRRTRTVFSSELISRDFRFILRIVFQISFCAPFRLAAADDPRYPTGWSEYSPLSHSKSMRFCGQRNGLVFRLLQSHLLRARPDEAPASPIGWDSGS